MSLISKKLSKKFFGHHVTEISRTEKIKSC